VTGRIVFSEPNDAPVTRGSFEEGCSAIVWTFYTQDCYSYYNESTRYEDCGPWYQDGPPVIIGWICPPTGGGGGGGGIGGGGTPKPDNPEKPKKNKRSKDPEDDCDNNDPAIRQATSDLMNQLQQVVAGTPVAPGSIAHVDYNAFKQAISANSAIEYSISMDKYPDYEGVYKNYITPVVQGTGTNVDLEYNEWRTVSHVHYHHDDVYPTPSAQDLCAAAANAKVSRDGIYKMSAVYTPSGDYYVIYVEDPVKAGLFYPKIQEQTDSTTNWFKPKSEMGRYLDRKSFRELGDNDENTMFQLTDLLNHYDSGMRLIKVNQDGTTETYGVRDEGKKFKIPTKCKD